MKQIFQIYKTDIRNVMKSWAALVIVLGLTILPSLYAWFNIKSSWDPYGNTKGISIAVVNEDKGTNLRGKDINLGKEIVSSLKKNKNLGWKFVDKETALDGVKYGKYYASLTIPKDFSEKIATVLSDNPEKPALIYDVNEKVNAIAPKITTKGATGVSEEVSKNFVKTANGEIFKVFNKLGIDLDTNLPSIEKVKELIFKLEGEFPTIHEVIDTSLTDASKAQDLVAKAQASLPTVQNVINNGQQITTDVDALFRTNSEVLAKAPEVIKQDLITIQQAALKVNQVTGFIDQLGLTDEQIQSIAQTLKKDLQSIRNIALSVADTTDPQTAVNSLQSIIRIIDKDLQRLSEINPNGKNEGANKLSELLTNIKNNVQQTIDKINNGEKPNTVVIKDLHELATNTVAAIDDVLATYDTKLVPLLQQLKQGADAISNDAEDALKTSITRLNTAIQLIDGVLTILQDMNQLLGNNQFDPEITQLQTDKDKLQKTVNFANKVLQTMQTGGKPSKEILDSMNQQSKEAAAILGDILAKYDTETVPKFTDAINRSKSMSQDVSKLLQGANDSLPDVKKLLADAAKGITLGKDEVEKIQAELPEAETKIKDLANRIREFESQEDIRDIIRLLKRDAKKESEFFAEPVTLKEHKLYPIPNYGSAMSPFFTTLSLWVGALLLVSLLTVEILDGKEQYRSHHIYFGRFLTFLTIALMQSVIVTVGDMCLLGTYVVHKFWFVIFGLFLSAIFMFLVYTLVSVFGNIGKSMAIILLVLQISGSGGTFPIQVTPKFFQIINPFLPFTYGISLMREAVGGILWKIVWKDLGVLLAFAAITVLIGIFLKKPFNRSSEKFVKNAKESKLIH
ncbi:YhgE/Pip family protein [Microbacteriaceae bacterium 4G12]